MEHFDASLSTYFRAWLGPRDTRVEGWFLLDNYVPTLVCSILYLLIVWLGPKYMKTRQPFSCRRILVVYNLGLTLLSLYMFCESESSLISLQDGDCRPGGRGSDRPGPSPVLISVFQGQSRSELSGLRVNRILSHT